MVEGRGFIARTSSATFPSANRTLKGVSHLFLSIYLAVLRRNFLEPMSGVEPLTN
jgi:hypothetical protein